MKKIILGLLICGSFSASAYETKELRTAMKEYKRLLKNSPSLKAGLKQAQKTCEAQDYECMNQMIEQTFIAESEMAIEEVEKKSGLTLEFTPIYPAKNILPDQLHVLVVGHQTIPVQDRISAGTEIVTYGPGIHYARPLIGSIVCVGTKKADERKYYGVRSGAAVALGLSFGTYFGKEGACVETQIQAGFGGFVGVGMYKTEQ